jgi:hypothetical protein
MPSPNLAGEKPAFFKRRDGIVYCRFRPRLGTLTWHSGAEHTVFQVPLWAQSAVKFMAEARGSWSIAAIQNLVYRDDVLALDQLIGRLVKVGFLEISLPPEE